jgi:tetratricopeptide (TPR) repeat protein
MAAPPEPTAFSPTAAWQRREEFIRRFEAAWRTGRRPAIEDYLPEPAADRQAVLVELVHADLELRLQAGEAVRVEDYLQRFPELNSPAVALDLIATEFAQRRRCESGLSPDEYARRFPAYQDELRARLPATAPIPQPLGPPTVPAPGPNGPPLDLDTTSPPAATSAGRDPAIQAPPAQAGHYLLEGEIAAGGMGQVFRAFDPELGRALAVKVLLERHRGQPELERRFRAEAQITGQLQHPGIPPVHEVGRLADGRPFFALKLIQGRTLADLLKERPRGADATPLLHDLPRFLGVFEQVCQALAYAHSRGVIHRDLKPANVMVGAFGEVQVMDWGLAKVLARAAPAEGNGPPAEAEVVRTLRTAPGEPGSQAGVVLGTPAYMPPEQARGEVGRLDERCDVFGLGTILCEVLTGQPPYVAPENWEVHLQAVQGDLADAHRRLEASGAEPELVGLARRCLAADPAERPRNAGEVAREVSNYLASVAERLRKAELVAARAAARAEQERKARRLTLALAGAVLALVLFGGAGWWWWQQEQARHQERTQAARRHVAEALRQATAFRQQARWADAQAELQQADDRLEADAPAGLRERLAQAREDLTLAAKLDGIRLGRAALVEGKLVPSSAAPKYAQVFRAHGLNVLGGDLEEVVAQIRGSAIRERLVAALDDWARAEPKQGKVRRLLAVARRADPGRLQDQLRDGKVRRDRQRLLRLARAAQAARLSPALIESLAWLLTKVKENPLDLLRRAREQHPGDFWLNFSLATELSAQHRWEQAAGYYRVALVLRPGSSIVWNNLGGTLFHQGRPAAAVKEFRRAIALDPKSAPAHYNLGNALRKQGQLPEAEREYRLALALDPESARAHTNLGLALAKQGKSAAAVRAYRRAIQIDPKLVPAHNGLGAVLCDHLHDYEGAVAAFRRAIQIDPKLAMVHANLGSALEKQGQVAAAVRAYRQAIALDPKYTPAHYKLGNTRAGQGKWAAAAGAYRRALALDPKLAPAHTGLGVALAQQGQVAAAVKEFRRALALDPKDALAHNGLGAVLSDHLHDYEGAVAAFRRALALNPKLAMAHANLGSALEKQGRVAAAVRAYRRALALNPQFARAHYNLGNALNKEGRWAGAVKAYRRAIALDPKYAPAHNWLGAVLCDHLHDYEGAVAAFRRALALDPKFAMAHYNLGNALMKQGKLALAVSSYRRALALNPQLARAHCNLGLVLQRLGRFTEALAALKRGHALGSPKPRWTYPSARWVRHCQRLIELDTRLPAVLAGKTKPRDAAEQIEFANLCLLKHRYGDAAHFFGGAFAARPKLADDFQAGHRYNAACAAALAAAGQGSGAAKLGARGKAQLRGQARTWLQADLALRAKQLQSDNPPERQAALQALTHWQKDPDLAGVRAREALAKLPAAERQEWTKFWAEVDTLLNRVGSAK